MAALVRLQHVAQCPGSRRAIAAAGQGLHFEAYGLYDELIVASDAQQEGQQQQQQALLGDISPSDAEYDSWWKGRMACLQVGLCLAAGLLGC